MTVEPGFRGPELVVGTINGYRTWRASLGIDGRLTLWARYWGVAPPWHPGWNQARCPYADCEPGNAKHSCGFWAYHRQAGSPELTFESGRRDGGYYVVRGTVEARGRTSIGPYGFRTAEARVTSLQAGWFGIPRKLRRALRETFNVKVYRTRWWWARRNQPSDLTGLGIDVADPRKDPHQRLVNRVRKRRA